MVSKPDSCEKEAKNGNLLTMHYTGTLQADGTKFDSSVDRGEPFKFQIGVGQVREVIIWARRGNAGPKTEMYSSANIYPQISRVVRHIWQAFHNG